MVGVCRQIGVFNAAYYAWKKRYGDLGATELRRLKMLEDENARLKRSVADLTLNGQILSEGARPKMAFDCGFARLPLLDRATGTCAFA